MAFLIEFQHGLLLLALVLHCALGGSTTWIVVQHLRHRRGALAAEANLLNTKLPPDEELPHVLVQIPTYNEGRLIRRAAEAMAGLDWPHDKLHVQLLDDSTDGSAIFAAGAAGLLRQRGIDAVLLHREHRAGFKAGALAQGLRQSNHEFVAIFDADYVPPPRFLRACMRALLADSGLALVQARCDFLNGDENSLTRVQQRLLDGHYAVEQATRSWTNQILPFNGTCGIWRRVAIDEAGGWQGDTLAEDLDLSYRVQLRGWRARFLVTVTVPGELPATLDVWRTQQLRWVKGFTEAARKLWPAVWRSRLPFTKKLLAQLHLSENLAGPLNIVTLVGVAVDFTVGVGFTWSVLTLFLLAQLQAKGSGIAMLLLGQQTARGATLAQELRRIPMIAGVALYGVIMTLRGVLDALTGRGSAFMRTPKRSTTAPAETPSGTGHPGSVPGPD